MKSEQWNLQVGQAVKCALAVVKVGELPPREIVKNSTICKFLIKKRFIKMFKIGTSNEDEKNA